MCNFAYAKKRGHHYDMRYAIIAAGEGSRLREEGITVPKPLIKINGETLLRRLVRIFMDNEAEDIVVITNDLYPEVGKLLEEMEHNGLPLRHVRKTTSSSMHSLYEIAPLLEGDKWIITTVDTIFDERKFGEYVKALSHTTADGIMAVTDYCDDEKPLYVMTDRHDGEAMARITAFQDDCDDIEAYISAGIYGLTSRTLSTLRRCVESGMSRMRNYQRELIADGHTLLAYPLGKVMDIDHKSDIDKAEEWLSKRHIIGIYRAQRYSPGSVEKDRAILDATLQQLRDRGYDVDVMTEEKLLEGGIAKEVGRYLSMARSEEALDILQDKTCINTSDAIRYCNHRRYITSDDNTPPLWVKRTDQCSEGEGDVTYCATEEEVRETVAMLHKRGIDSYVMQKHYEGEHVKFYGVRGTTFFSPSGYDTLRGMAQDMAREAGITVYGGDAIIGADGEIHIIDLNDWPSFASCRKEAAEAIAEMVQTLR